MTRDEFAQQLRTLLRRRPFQPFTVILLTGDRIEVDAPEAVSLGGGAAGYLSPSGEAFLFDCRGVREIVESAPEAAS
jgi:hypothetical protein